MAVVNGKSGRLFFAVSVPDLERWVPILPAASPFLRSHKPSVGWTTDFYWRRPPVTPDMAQMLDDISRAQLLYEPKSITFTIRDMFIGVDFARGDDFTFTAVSEGPGR